MSRVSMIGLAAVVLLGTPGARAEDVELPDTPVGRRTRGLLEALGSGDRETIGAFIQENFAPSFLRDIPLDRHVDVNVQVATMTGGLVPSQIASATETELRLQARAKKGGAGLTLIVEVEELPSHRIARLGFARPRPGPPVAVPELPAGTLSREQFAHWLGDYLERLTKAEAFSGAMLVTRGDEALFSGAYGLASRAWNQPNRLDTKFNLGSMNKMFTAIAIAQLVEQGKVSLDDPIGRHLPDYPNRQAAEKVTVRHLLDHTSGLADYFNEKFMDSSRMKFRVIADYFPLFAGEPLLFEPGTRTRYSNAGFMVLGAIVQAASGQDYFEYVREHIYKPAGMVNTDAYELDRDVPNLAVGYHRGEGSSPEDREWRNNTFLHVIRGGPAGGGYSTVEDLDRFARALRQGKLIKPETFREWTTPGDVNRTYGLGFQIFRASDPKCVGHRGGFPGISSGLWMDLDGGINVMILSNTDGGADPVADAMEGVLRRLK